MPSMLSADDKRRLTDHLERGSGTDTAKNVADVLDSSASQAFVTAAVAAIPAADFSAVEESIVPAAGNNGDFDLGAANLQWNIVYSQEISTEAIHNEPGTGNGVEIYTEDEDVNINSSDVTLSTGQVSGSGVRGIVSFDGKYILNYTPIVASVTASVPGATFILSPASSYLHLSPAGAVESNAATPIAAGSLAGQMLTITIATANNLTLKAGGNVKLPGGTDLVLGQHDSAQFIWNGSAWICVSTQVNA